MKEHPKHRIEAVVDALLRIRPDGEHRKISHRRSTLCQLRNRRDQETLEQAARTFLISYGGIRPREMDDLGSELALRKVALPCEEVSAEAAAVARRIGRMMTPKVTHECKTVSVNFSMISKAHEIEDHSAPPTELHWPANSGLGQHTNQHRCWTCSRIRLQYSGEFLHVPTLHNPRHERFAQELAAGDTADAAYVLAGYQENRSNAARLNANREYSEASC